MVERDVEIPLDDGVALSTTFVEVERPRAAVLILSGSGPLDRNSNMPGQALDIAGALAEALAARGAASLRYDKRGVGRSGGDYLATGFHDETEDAARALAALRDLQAGLPAFVVGHSVGATIAMRLASRDPAIAGAVLLSGAARSGEAVMRTQSARFAETLPWWQRPLAPVLLWRQAAARRKLAASTGDTIRLGGQLLPARWMREYMAYDPLGDLAGVSCPVLGLTGAADVQVEPSDLAIVGSLIAGPFTAEAPENISHLLRRTERPGLASYAEEIGRPVEPAIIARVADWIVGEGSRGAAGV